MSTNSDLHIDDADLALISDYLAGDLSPEGVAEVERRLRDDAEFRWVALPLMRVWTSPGRLGNPNTRSIDDTCDELEAELLPPPKLTSSRKSKRAFRDWPHWAQAAAIALLAIKLAAFGGGTVMIARGLQTHRGESLTTITLNNMRAAAAATRDSSTINFAVPTDSAAQEATLLGGSRVTLSPGATLSFSRVSRNTYAAQFNGAGSFEISAASRGVMVYASTGRALLSPGTYAVEATDSALVVHVKSGYTMAYTTDLVAIYGEQAFAGQSAIVRRDGKPFVVTTPR